ncbi:Diaminopimelate epimerase, partial [termite gut metagenome]
VSTVTVDMGSPSDSRTVDFAGEYPFTATALSMGNPHLVIFTDDINSIALPDIGPKLENHPFFPGRINVEFAQVLGDGKIRTRVWERGSGITQACGTGACATAVAAAINGKAGRKTDIVMDGGTLTIAWDEQSGHVFLTGNAVKVFDGFILT